MNVDREKQIARAVDVKAAASKVVRHHRRNAGDSIVMSKRSCRVVSKADGQTSPFRLLVETVARLAALGELRDLSRAGETHLGGVRSDAKASATACRLGEAYAPCGGLRILFDLRSDEITR